MADLNNTSSIINHVPTFLNPTSPMTMRVSRLLALLAVLSCSGTAHTFTVLPHQGRHGVTRLNAAQILEFKEPSTNVTVVLVGAMHYNPASIKLASDTVNGYGKKGKLGSVIIESCDIRWNKTAELYAEKPLLKKILNNEMRTACDAAISMGRPVVLGDQRIDITVEELKSSLKMAFDDLILPPKGWKRFADEVSQAWSETVPLGGKGYLQASSFFDPKILLAFPVSLIKYPLSYLVRDPLPTSIFLLLLGALTFSTDPVAAYSASSEPTPWRDLTISFWVAFLETTIFARVLLKPMLADRNVILADNILAQCKLYTTLEGQTERPSIMRNKMENATSTSDIIYAPGSPNIGVQSNDDDMVVVAILGMAHCNGIKKLLRESEV